MRLLLLLLLNCSFLVSSATDITGQNKEYAGKKLRFFRYADPVTREKVEVFTLDVDAAGNFKATPAVENTTFVFSEFGIYRGNLFLEPDRKMELLLPPLREKSFAESKNPYFTPVEFWIVTKEGQYLNDEIAAFDSRLNQLTDHYFNQLFFSQSANAFDSLQIKLQQQFNQSTSEAFIQHKTLKLKAVEADAFRLSPGKIAPALQEVEPAQWTYPAFVQLFEKTFAGKLSFEAQTRHGNDIRKAVAKKDISFFTHFIKSNYNASPPFSDLVLLKMLHDGFYSGDFPQESILNMLSLRHFTDHQNPVIRQVAANVTKKLNHLRKGSKAPVICLENLSGKEICTDQNKEKFKYLIFADTEMIVVREQLKYLSRINEMFHQHLEIIVVLLKTDLIGIKKFMTEEKIPGIHLVDENREYIEKYRVKSYPTCYLLNGSHEVVFPDTKAPLDGFEQQFGTFLRQHLFEQQRNQGQ